MRTASQVCSDIDADLLMHGLGELPYWRSWTVSRHVTRCSRCARRQTELMAAARGMAETLRSPTGIRMPATATTVSGGWLMVATVVLVVATSILAVYVGINQYASYRATHTKASQPCLPGLRSDKCR